MKEFIKNAVVLVVLVLVILLAGTMILNQLPPEGTGQYEGCKNNLKSLGSSCEMYATDWSGHFPDSLDALEGPKYLSAKTLPKCMAAGADSYSAGYKKTKEPDKEHIEIFCKGHNHKSLSAKDYPKWNSQDGILEKKPES